MSHDILADPLGWPLPTPMCCLVAIGQFYQHSTSSFYVGRSQKRKKDINIFLALSGSGCAKAAHGTLMKLTHCLYPPTVSRINWIKLPLSMSLTVISNQNERHSIGCSLPINIGLINSVVTGGSLTSWLEVTNTKYPDWDPKWSLKKKGFFIKLG